MESKNYLISKYWVEDNEFNASMYEKVEGFISENFTKEQAKNISYEIYYYDGSKDQDFCSKYYWSFCIEIVFEEFEYYNKVHGESCESIGLHFSPINDELGVQFVWRDNQYDKVYVYNNHTGEPIQKTEMIYGHNKDDLYNKFSNYILTV